MATVYQMVTDRIIAQIRSGVIPWQQPWAGGQQLAISYTTRKPYSFLNQLLLGKPGEWLTWNQIQAHGGNVRRGARSRFCVFYQELEPPQPGEAGNNDDEPKRRFILRWYKVFHIDNTEGIESRCSVIVPDPSLSPIQAAEDAIREYLNREPGLKFINDQPSASAYYSPALDEIVVPMLSQYSLAEEYYSTAFHELTHSTMHPDRCARAGENKAAHFDSEAYSREELVAEMGAAMLCNRVGIENEKAFRNSAAYIQNWLTALQNDNRMVIWASKRAEEAAKYILGERKEEVQTALQFSGG